MNSQGKKFHAAIVILAFLLALGVAALPAIVDTFGHGPQENSLYSFLFFWKWIFTQAESAPFAACAFLCFLVSGFFWYRASGQKKIFCYILFLSFALIVGFGSVSYEFTYFTMPGDTRLEEPDRSIFWEILGAGVLAQLLIEAIARWLYPPEK